jgi:arabinogalactan oligomer / maltooligosaccharide transport system substrate-binding protein
MPTIPQVTYYWGPGETMIKEVWNVGKEISTATKEAEASYRTLSGLTS